MFDFDFQEKDHLIFSQIEKIREELCSRSEEIRFYDYGAISPDLELTQEEMSRGKLTIKPIREICAVGLKDKWGQLIYGLVKKHRPKTILELGTCCGFSALYMAKANPETTIFTLEGAREISEIALNNFQRADCPNIVQIVGRFQDLLFNLLKEIPEINFVLIDGHHNREATLRYFSQIKPFLGKNSILIFDDISWSKGMKKAWQEIIKDERIKEYNDLGKLGICYL